MPKGGEQKRKEAAKQDAAETETADTAAAAEKAESIKGDIDELLDEIDEVLESNAEEFVRSYVQKGGQ